MSYLKHLQIFWCQESELSPSLRRASSCSLRPSNDSIFSTLEDRVRTLEARIRDHENRLINVEESGQARDVGPDVEARPEGPGSVVVNIDGIQDPPTDHSMTDGMAISFVDEEDCVFFGEAHPLFTSADDELIVTQGLLQILPSCDIYSAP